jgi:hypothetical protein
MAKTKKRKFASAREIASNRDSGGNYGYFKLPKNIQMFLPETETTVKMDILPYEVTDTAHMDRIEPGVMTFKKPYKVHRRIIGPNKDSAVCPTTFNKPCPICEQRQALLDAGKDYKDDDVKNLKPSLRNLYVVKILEHDGKKKYDKKALYLFDFSDYYFQDVFEKQLKKKDEWETFFLPEEGCSIEVIFDESQFKSPEATRIDFVARKKQYSDDILDEVPNLDEVLVTSTYEELEAKFHNEELDEETPKKEKKAKKSKKDKKEKAEEPEAEEKPAKKSKKSKKDKEPEPEEAKPEKKAKKGKKEKEEAPKEEKKSKKLKCAYGHKFGKDADKFEDCEDCELWNECKATKKANKKK